MERKSRKKRRWGSVLVTILVVWTKHPTSKVRKGFVTSDFLEISVIINWLQGRVASHKRVIRCA